MYGWCFFLEYSCHFADNFQCHVNLGVLYVGDLHKATHHQMFVRYSHLQFTPASSPWPQVCLPHPPWEQELRLVSLPVHLTSSNQMVPVPCPNEGQQEDEIAPGNPSSLQTTVASYRSQPSSHTVPHVLL